MSTLENDVLIPKRNLLRNGASRRGFQPKDGRRVIWNRVEQMDSATIDLALGWHGIQQNATVSISPAQCLQAHFSYPQSMEKIYTATQI